MYSPAYGYGPGNTSAGAQTQAQAPSPFNPNNGGLPQPPQTQTPHHQLHHQQHHQQQPGQQPQHMMYNPQAQAQAQAQQYAVAHQPSPYGGASGPGMAGGNAGAMGMMQNNGMAQMPGSHVPTYQTPYSSSPYGNIPSTASSLPPNFMPTTSNAPSFPMNAQGMNLQHQAQRMQPPPTSSTPTLSGQRASPFPGAQHGTPPNAGQAPSQFSTPQTINQTHLQTPNHNQQAQGQTVVTPQTPNFPPGAGAGGGGPIATPLSPGSESREKERVTLLLEINNGLLKEVMRIQAIQAEVKKDEAAAAASPEAADKEKAEKEKAEKLKTPSREYVECMRRLQSNLAYLAAIADRSHKPSSQIPPHPAIMSAPPLSPKSAPSSNSTASPKFETKKEETEEKKWEDSHEDQSEILKDLYKKLQALFPGVDPKKEPPIAAPNQAARAQAQAQQQAAAHLQAQKQQQQGGQSGGVDPNAQQKMQNDMLRQKMMQQAAQQQAQQQQMQGMPGMSNPNPQQMNNMQQGQVQSR